MSVPSTQAEHPAYKLRQELETYIVHGDYPSRSFITKKSIDRCWPEDLHQLKCKLGLTWGDTELLSILAGECRTIACILAWIKYEDFDAKLQAICRSIQHTTPGQSLATFNDSQLILDQDKCKEIFECDERNLFYQNQFVFCPILISSAASGIHEVHPERRWPYASSAAEIGFGAYGRVYRVAIVKGQLQATKDSSNDEEELVAFKRVERPKAWRKEVKNLDFLKGSLSGHKRLLLHIAAFIQGSEFFIFLPYTPYGDLETFLREGTWQNDNSEDFTAYDFAQVFGSFGRLDLAREFAAVIDATGFLHERVSSVKGLPVYCAHVDLRTKNILVFPGGKEHPAGVWHISDFGISSIQLEEGQALPEPVWSKYPSMGDIVDGRWALSGEQSTSHKLVGPHVAPEMSIHKISMPRESDVWSLGCILTEVLVFGLGTKQPGNQKKKLDEFRRERRSFTSSDRDDYFFDRKVVTNSDTDEMQVTVSRRPKVDEWLTHLHNQCGRLYHYLTSTLDEMLQPDPRKRCTAKFASESVLKACEKSSEIQTPAEVAKTLSASWWSFSATQQIVGTDSTGELVFVQHLPPDTGSESEIHLQPSPEDEGPDPARSDSPGASRLQRKQTIDAEKGPSRIWSNVGHCEPKAVAVTVSSSKGIVVLLCQKQETSNSKSFFPYRKGSRKELYELQFRKEAESAGDSEAYSSYSLPPSAKWCELRVIDKHAFVTGPGHGSSPEQQIHIYDFVAGVEVKIPEDKDLSKMHKFTSSGDEVLAAYDDKAFALWQPDKTVYKDIPCSKIGNSGQIKFSSDGLFLFTWSIYETDEVRVWTIQPAAKPQICALYIIPRPSYRARFEPLLVPCGSLPACIIRTRHGVWYTASTGLETPQRGSLKVTEQCDLGANLPERAALCTANERYFFFLCEKGCVCICDLVWDNDTTLRIVRRPKAWTKSALKIPSSMVLHAKANGKYDLIITNREGEVESIEVKC